MSIDGLNNSYLFNEWQNPNYILTPNIGEIIKAGAYYTKAEVPLPTLTQTNHIVMVCGCYPEKIGFAGNEVYIREKKGPMPLKHPWKDPEMIKCDTIMKAMERKDAEYTTAIIAGKNYVGCPIWADYTIGPNCISDSVKADFLELGKFSEIAGWDSPDDWVIDNALLVLERKDPEFMLLHLAFVDAVQHHFGHGSNAAWASISWADHQVGELIRYLKRTAKLNSTLIIITSDHGLSNIGKVIDIRKLLDEAGIDVHFVQSLGTLAYVFLKDKKDIPQVTNFLQNQDFVDGVWSGESLNDIHIKTPYTGDIVLSLAPPYSSAVFQAPFFNIITPELGGHGGLMQRFVPLIFFGPGVKQGVRLDNVEKASLVDIVPTISSLTGLPLPSTAQGSILSVKDDTYRKTPTINYFLKLEKGEFISYLPTFFFLLSILLLIAYYLLKKRNSISIGHGIILITSLSFGVCSAMFIQFLRLYATVPDILPDNFLLAKKPYIWGTPVVGQPIVQLLFWMIFWGVFGLVLGILSKIIAKGSILKIMKVFPVSLTPWIYAFLFIALINLYVSLNYSTIALLYYTFWWVGFALSCIMMIFIVYNTCKTTIIASISIVAIFATLFVTFVVVVLNISIVRFVVAHTTFSPGMIY